MEWKKFRLVIFSFLTGILLMTGVMLGAQNQDYFSSSSPDASDSSLGVQANNNSNNQSNIPVAIQQLNPISSNSIIADMVEAAGPAVVRIETKTARTQRYSNPFGEYFGFSIPFNTLPEDALGSGFIIDEEGHILTNYHVIDDADSIQVFVSDFEKPFTASVIGYDEEMDLAVLKIEAKEKFPYLKMGDSDAIRVGDWSVAIGNPFGLDHTVTVGVISAKSRPLQVGKQQFKDLLQTDTSINPGNSGGPLLNLYGEVIGINTAINSEGQGLGFAIPINSVKEVLDDLINKGKVSRPFVGIGLSDLNNDIANYFGFDFTEGAIITQIYRNSAAEKAGLKQYDVILEVDGKKIKNSQELVDLIGKMKVGDQLKFLIWRSGELKTITVTIGER